VGLAVVDPLAKFKQCSFIPEILKGSKIFKSVTRPRQKVQGNFFTPEVNPATLDPFAKFEERSFIHSRNIEGV